MSTIKLSEISAQFLDSIDEGKHSYRKVYSLAIRGLRELNWDVTGTVKSKELTVLSNKTAELPHDYVNFTMIGVLNQKGEVVPLTRNDKLTGFNSKSGSRLESESQKDTGSTLNSWHNIGEYRIDKKGGIVIFDPEFEFDTIILEYLSNDTEHEDGDYIIDEMVSEALLAFIQWKYHLTKKNISAFDKKNYEGIWITEKKKARARLFGLKRQEMLQAVRQGLKL